MGLRISTNAASLTASRLLTKNSEDQARSYEKLASGQRINHSADDAAGLAISESLRSQVRSMAQAERNANDSISFAQVAEGGLTEVSNILIRLRELGIQAASDTIGDRERGYISEEVRSLLQEVDRISNVTNFNGTPLLNAQAPKGRLQFQVGIQSGEQDRIEFDTEAYDVRTNTLGIDTLGFESIDGAYEGLNRIDDAMGKVLSVRSSIGALQNKLQSTVRTLGLTRENLSIARSRIADTDLAAETSELVRANILHQSGIAVLAQANTAPSQALKLIM